MLSSIPGIENLSPAVKYVIAFAIIFVLLAIFALVLRRLTGGRLSLANERGRARQPRLGIVDVYDLDRQRQLILLRRDNVEHLLLVGGPNDVVVETNIMRVPGARLPASTPDMLEAAVENGTARPVIEPTHGRVAERMPEPVVAGRLNPIDTATATPPASLASRGAPEPALRTVAPAPRPTDRGRDEMRNAAGAGGHPPPGGTSAPSGMARQLEEALRGAPTPDRVPPPAEKPARFAPAPSSPSPARTPEPATRGPEPKVTPPPPTPAPRPEPRPMPEPAKPEVSKAVPAARPVPEMKPNPEPRPTAEPAKAAPEPPRPVPEPPKPAAEPPKPVPEPAKPIVEPPKAAAPAPPRPEPTPAPRPAPPPASPPEQSEPARPQRDAKPSPPPPAPEPTPAKPSSDPFSIEDIEAEFARLLGRPLDRKDDRG